MLTKHKMVAQRRWSWTTKPRDDQSHGCNRWSKQTWNPSYIKFGDTAKELRGTTKAAVEAEQRIAAVEDTNVETEKLGCCCRSVSMTRCTEADAKISGWLACQNHRGHLGHAFYWFADSLKLSERQPRRGKWSRSGHIECQGACEKNKMTDLKSLLQCLG